MDRPRLFIQVGDYYMVDDVVSEDDTTGCGNLLKLALRVAVHVGL